MEKPILFSTPMVKAILECRKTQTRRVIEPQPRYELRQHYGGWNEYSQNPIADETTGSYWGYGYKCPYGKPGDIFWVRETWNAAYRDNTCTEVAHYIYRASEPNGAGWWKPSIFMPKEAARIFLRVTNVRVERLQDISEEDAIAEGLYRGFQSEENSSPAISAKQAFMWIWQKINGHKSWLENPWVWVIEFEVKEVKA